MDIRNKLNIFKRMNLYGLHKKMFAAIFSVGLVLIISLSIAILQIAGEYIREDVKGKLQDQTQQVSNITDSYIENMRNTIVAVNLNQAVVDLMSGGYTDFQAYIIYRDTYRLLNTLKSVNRLNNLFVFCGHNKDLLSSDPVNITGDYEEYNVANSNWYKKIMYSPQNLILIDNFTPPVVPNGDKFAMVLKVQHFYKPEIQGLIIISVDKTYFSEILENTSYTSRDFLIIANADGDVVYTSNSAEAAGKHIDKDMITDIVKNGKEFYKDSKGKRYVVNITISKTTGWSFIGFSDEKILIDSIYRMNILIIAITSVCITLLLVLSSFISSRFTNPVKRLMKFMQKAEGLNYRIVSDIERNDEIGDLSRCFNEMVKRVLEDQVLRREAEIEALQQQINPHFLYNTLESIKTLAAIHGNDDIRSMAQRLGDMFRYSINRERNKIVSISEEIRHVDNYIVIQKYRYEDRLNVVYEIQEEIGDYQTLKFILQPIVENAIYHGIEEISAGGLIKIRGYFDGKDILFVVGDNGKGMDAMELEQLNAYISGNIKDIPLKKTQSIGLKNIQERVSMFFGEGYGIKIYSEKGIGTQAVLKIPVWIKREESGNV